MKRLVLVGGLALLALLTVHRLPVWVSDVSLWQAAVSEAPDDPRALINLGVAVEAQGDLDQAQTLYRHAVAQSTEDAHASAVAWMNLATIAANQLDWPRAFAAVQQAHHYEPTLHHRKLESDLARHLDAY